MHKGLCIYHAVSGGEIHIVHGFFHCFPLKKAPYWGIN